MMYAPLARLLARPLPIAARAARTLLCAALTIAAAPAALAGDAAVVDVAVQALGEGRFRIDATLRHDDTGWDHYANRWDVLADDGTLLGSRELAHPHVEEQPFTRSLTLAIPADVVHVTVRAVDSVHGGEGGETVRVEVPH